MNSASVRKLHPLRGPEVQIFSLSLLVTRWKVNVGVITVTSTLKGLYLPLFFSSFIGCTLSSERHAFFFLAEVLAGFRPAGGF